MAEKVIIQLTDDLDGSEATETIHYAVNGSAYRIDLNEKNAKRFYDALKPFIEVSQPAGTARATAARPSRTPASSKRRSSGAAAAGVDPKAVRVWADENKIEVPARGRIPASIVEQYKAATGS